MPDSNIEQNMISQVLSYNDYKICNIVNSNSYFLDKENSEIWGFILDRFRRKGDLSFAKVITDINASSLNEKFKKLLLKRLENIQTEIYIFHKDMPGKLIHRYIEQNVKNFAKKFYNIGNSYTLQDVERDLEKLRNIVKEDSKIKEATNYEKAKFSYLESIANGKIKIDNGLIFNHPVLNVLFNNYIYPKSYIIAGRPGFCKSMLSNNIFLHLSNENQQGIYFSLENSNIMLTKDLMSIEAGVSSNVIRRNAFNEGNYARLLDKSGKSKVNTKWIYDNNFDVYGIRRHTESMMEKYKIKFIIIDYFQIIKRWHRKSQTEEYENMSSFLREMRKELGIAMFLLSQVNDRQEDKKDKKILFQLGELKGTGSLEQDADEVLGMQGVRKDPYRDVKIAKSRLRALGNVDIEFDFETGRLKETYSEYITESEENEQDDLPI